MYFCIASLFYACDFAEHHLEVRSPTLARRATDRIAIAYFKYDSHAMETP